MKKFAISDIHGCKDTFVALLDKIQFTTSDELYLLGDYIDRGYDSKGVIDTIWKLQNEGFMVKCLRGNHEELMLNANYSRRDAYIWMKNGGQNTLNSFEAELYHEIPQQYIRWMEKLPLYFEVDRFILTHAGFKFELPNPFDERHAMLWQRRWYDDINYHWLADRIIVHGHTAIGKDEILQQFKKIETNQYLDIDAGCVYKNKFAGDGYLCALDMTNMKLVFQENVG